MWPQYIFMTNNLKIFELLSSRVLLRKIIMKKTAIHHSPSPIARDKLMSKVFPAIERAFPLSAAVMPAGNVTRRMWELMNWSIVCSMSADNALCSSTVFSLATRSVSFRYGLMSRLVLTTDSISPKTLNPATFVKTYGQNTFWVLKFW